MGPLRVRHEIRRKRRYGAAIVVVLAVSAAIAAHHALPSAGSMHHDGGVPAVELCLGVLTVVGAAVAAVALALVAPRRLRGRLVLRRPPVVVLTPLPLPQARAGPAFLCVMRC